MISSRQFYWTSAVVWAVLAFVWTLIAHFVEMPRWVAGLGGYALGCLTILFTVALVMVRVERRRR